VAAVWLVIVVQFRGRWTAPVDAGAGIDVLDGAPFDLWQSAKGLAVAATLLVVFLFLPWPREVAALVGAGVLLLSRRLHSRRMLGLVDWGLLVLFIGLFVVNAAFERTGLPARALALTASAGLSLAAPAPLFGAAFALSNIVSNVPAVMLLLPAVRGPGAPAFAGPMLALVSTFAGNLLIVGSIANIIVVDAARRRGIEIGWRAHARVGVPVTLLTLGITAAWFAVHP
jgi:Na+/H+ antiporter NhaD/arsenite permease-like protein